MAAGAVPQQLSIRSSSLHGAAQGYSTVEELEIITNFGCDSYTVREQKEFALDQDTSKLTLRFTSIGRDQLKLVIRFEEKRSQFATEATARHGCSKC